MSIAALNWAFNQPVMGAAKAVLIVLADHVDQDGWCWPTVARIGFRAGCDVRTVQRALRQLAGDGLIQAEIAVGRGHVSRYRLFHNLDEHQEVPQKRQDTADKGDTVPPIEPIKGDISPPLAATVKGDTKAVKGDNLTRKGDVVSPKPLRTTNRTTKGGARARRAQPPPRNVFDQILEELGGVSFFMRPEPEHNQDVRRRLIQ